MSPFLARPTRVSAGQPGCVIDATPLTPDHGLTDAATRRWRRERSGYDPRRWSWRQRDETVNKHASQMV